MTLLKPSMEKGIALVNPHFATNWACTFDKGDKIQKLQIVCVFWLCMDEHISLFSTKSHSDKEVYSTLT